MEFTRGPLRVEGVMKITGLGVWLWGGLIIWLAPYVWNGLRLLFG